MDDDSRELVKIGIEAALAPALDGVRDFLGVVGLDWLKETRKRNQERLSRRTKELRQHEQGKPAHGPTEVSPSILLPILLAAQDESDEGLIDLWARLLLAAERGSARKSFIETLKNFDALDARVFAAHPQITGAGTGGAAQIDKAVAASIESTPEAVLVSFENLGKLGLLANPQGGPSVGPSPYLTVVGRELARALRLWPATL